MSYIKDESVPTLLKSILLQVRGRFAWAHGPDWLIETPIGNFHWSDPDYNGDNTIRPYQGDSLGFSKEFLHGNPIRDKGFHDIERYCGTEFTVVLLEDFGKE